MKDYVLKRLLLAIPTMLGITLVTFLVIQLAPGSPVESMMPADQGIRSDQVTKEIVERTKKLYGLDRPVHERYLSWLRRTVTLDFGNSYRDHRPVMEKIAERLPVTLALNVLSIFLVYLLAIPLGAWSAVRQRSPAERATTFVLFLLYSIPSFWMAVVLIYFFGGGYFWDVFPIYGVHSRGFEELSFFGRAKDFLWHLVLPVFCLAYAGLASLSRFQKGSLLEVLREDYITAARAKGLSRNRVLFKHALRNSLIPIVTIVASILPAMIGGSVIIETIFSIPGIGRLGFESVLSRDYPVIMAVATISAFLTLAGILLSDVAYAVVDPRIGFGGRS